MDETIPRVLIDTSVWIDFFHGKLLSLHREALIALLDAEEVIITDIIRHEILVGASTDKDFAQLSRLLDPIETHTIADGEKTKFNRFGFELRQKGLLGRYTDLSIAFIAKERNVPIYSFDRYFNKLSSAKIIQSFEPRR